MEVVLVANAGDDDPGYVGERLEQVGGRLRSVHRDDPAALASAEKGADLVVLLGSDWSVYDPAHARSVAAEQALVRRATARGLPLFGICFGGQLSASALGGTVRRADHPELGWYEVTSEDSSLAGRWFQFHGDRWDATDDLPGIAWGEQGPQAFRQGRTLGIQFHPEVTPTTARRWLRASAASVVAAGGDLATIEDELDRLAPDARDRCHRLVDAFLTMVSTDDTREEPRHGVARGGDR